MALSMPFSRGAKIGVGGSVSLYDAALKSVSFDAAKIGGSLTVSRSTVEGAFSAPGLSVQGDLFLNVFLLGAFSAPGLSVQGGLFLRDKATFEKVDLSGAKIGTRLDARGSTFEDMFTALDLSVQGNLSLSNKAEFEDVDLSGARIGQNLAIHGSTFSGKFDLSDADVGNVFILNDGAGVPSWRDGSRLVLRNLSVGVLQDHKDAWEGLGRLDLIGFVYERIGGANVEAGQETDSPKASQEIASRSTDWLAAWLNKQENSESVHFPQPYQQLADTLRAQGFSDKADAIMIAANDHRYSLPDIDRGTKALLWIEWATIGYGYESSRSLAWLAASALLGTIVGSFGKDDLARSALSRRFWYSVDQLIPLLQLDSRHAALTPAGWRGAYFYLQHIMGFILASLLAAALSGLAK